jgi:hypothetical protein
MFKGFFPPVVGKIRSACNKWVIFARETGKITMGKTGLKVPQSEIFDGCDLFIFTSSTSG